MRKSYKIISILTVLIISISIPVSLMAQSKAMIENIDFYAEGSNLVIKYDIVKAKDGEVFEIWVKLTTASGQSIIPQTMTGDVGSGIMSGPNKRIEWDLNADNTTIDEEFSVEVFAKSSLQETTKVEKPKKEGISVGGAMLLSAVLPGLGRTVAKGGGSQWMWGVIGYGCIAGTVIMNNQAYNAYEDYKVATDPTERDDFFTKAEENDTYSKIFLGTAATIWIIDIISTGVQAGKIRKSKNQSNFSLNYNIDPTGKPLVGFTYRF